MKMSLTQSALLITGLSLASSLVALAVDVATAAFFGAGAIMDAYLTAAVVPNILALTVPSTLAVVFVPVFQKILRERGTIEAWQAASKVFNVLGLLLIILALLSLPFAEKIIKMTAPGFPSNMVNLGAILFRWMMIGSIFIGLNALLAGLHNASFQFGLPAFMPIVRNLITFLGIVLFANYYNIVVLAYAAVVAALVQFFFLAPDLIKKGRYSFSVSLKDPEILNAMRMALIMMLGGIAYSGYGIIDRFIGSFLPSGSISYLGYANKLGMFFSNTISVGIGTVAFSRFSNQAAAGDHKALASELVRVLSVTTLVLLPALAVVLALREPLLSILFERKEFNADAVVQTGYAMLGYAGLLVVLGIGRPITLAFYSIGDTKTPVIINTVSLLIYLPIAYFLCITLNLGFIGIAGGTSLIHLINFIWYIQKLKTKIEGLDLGVFYKYSVKISAYSVVVGMLCYVTPDVTGFFLSDHYADMSALIMGGMIWGSFNMYLFYKKDAYLIKICEAIRMRKGIAS